MKLLIKILLAILICSIWIAALAEADDTDMYTELTPPPSEKQQQLYSALNQLYVSAIAGANYNYFKPIGGIAPTVVDSTAVADSDSAVMVGGAIGYRSQVVPARIEFYYSYNFKQRFIEDVSFINDPQIVRTNVGFTQSIYLIRLFYDFFTYERFTAYIGGGAGFSDNRVSAYQADVPPPSARTADFPATVVHDLAWQVAFGFNVGITKLLSVGLGYSFTAPGEIRTATNCSSNSATICTTEEYHRGIQEINSVFAVFTFSSLDI